jgi:hypothetical protein
VFSPDFNLNAGIGQLHVGAIPPIAGAALFRNGRPSLVIANPHVGEGVPPLGQIGRSSRYGVSHAPLPLGVERAVRMAIEGGRRPQLHQNVWWRL